MIWLTENLPGTGGIYKQDPQDFQVEEIPLYPCSGEGEHLYLWIEKAGITTHELLNQLTRGLKLRERDLGYAGLKDARAVTRQMISIPFNKLDQANKLNLKRSKILTTSRHSNKLRLGHLAGNRFTITIRKTDAGALSHAEEILTQLKKRGVPNFFGEQRYGILGNSAQLGLLLVQKEFTKFCQEYIGDPEVIRNQDWKEAAEYYQSGKIKSALQSLPKRMHDEQRLLRTLLDGKSHRAAVSTLPRNLLRLFLSAAQSRFFDQLLKQRLSTFDQLNDGDIAVKHVNGACFRVENAAEEQSRVDSFEISPSAPLYGSKVMIAAGKTGQEEVALLDKAGLTLDSWKLAQGLTMPGERRPLRVPLSEPKIVSNEDHSLTLSFALPKGSYATSVLRELIK